MKTLLLSLIMLFSLTANAVAEKSSKELEKLIPTSKLPIIIDIYADWCGACKNLEPLLKQAEKDFAGKVLIYKINGEKNPEVKGKVRAYPTLLFIKKVEDGKIGMAKIEGSPSSQKELNDLIQRFLDHK